MIFPEKTHLWGSCCSTNYASQLTPPDRESTGRALLLGHTKLEITVWYPGVEVDDALQVSVQVEL